MSAEERPTVSEEEYQQAREFYMDVLADIICQHCWLREECNKVGEEKGEGYCMAFNVVVHMVALSEEWITEVLSEVYGR